MSKFAQDNNVFFEFHANTCFIKSHVSKEVLLEGFLDTSGLYSFSSQSVESPAANVVSLSTRDHSQVLANSVCNKLSVWHNRLGHTNSVNLKFILKLCNIASSNKDNTDCCSSCNVGKSHRLYAPLSTTVYSKSCELVHVDLWGPSPNPSSKGYFYYMAIADTYT